MDFPVRHLSSIFAGKKTRALLKFDFCNRLRVLAPGRGTALLGRSKAAGAGLSENALKAWVTKLPLAKVISDDSGIWVILRTSLPSGSDPWTHRLHVPENSQASSDTTPQSPFITQWWGLPRQEGFWGTTVVACNGRMFAIWSSRRPSDQVSLTACAVDNVWIGGSQPLDLKTGKIAKGPTFIASGCGPTNSTPGYLVTCFGSILDLKSGKVIKQDDIKSPCDVGSIISDGLMITMPSECGCAYPLKGYRVLTSAGKFQMHTAPDRKKRLTVLDKSVPAPRSSRRRPFGRAACWRVAETAGYIAWTRQLAAVSGNSWPRQLTGACSGMDISSTPDQSSPESLSMTTSPMP